MSTLTVSRESLWRIAIFGIGLCAVATLSACGAGGVSHEGGGQAVAVLPAEGEDDSALAPEFTLPAVDGREIRLSDSAGQVRLIDFWATWCAPCREEVPMLNELQAEYGDRGFRILAIADAGEDEDVIRDFLAEHDVSYTNLFGTEEVTQSYRVFGLPAAYLIDGDGRVVESFLGPKPRKALVQEIERLLQLAPEEQAG